MKKPPKITSLTPEQTANLAVYRDKWIGVALSTGRMTDAERATVNRCVRGMYRSAKLPEPKAVVVVPSPFVMAIAGGAASWWWHQHKSGALAATAAATAAATEAATADATRAATADATRAATEAATEAATADATRASTADATWDATRAATAAATWDATEAATEAATAAATRASTAAATRASTEAATAAATRASTADATRASTADATRAATEAATEAATRAATADATWDATRDATWDATRAATAAATEAACARNWSNCYQGGNMWAGWTSYLDFWSTILGDRDDCKSAFDSFRDYRELGEISGYRWMAPDFCMVCEKPIKLATEVDSRGTHVAHCEDGPSHLWADGFAIWHWHGVSVKRHVIEAPETITLDEIASESNAEVRRVLRERFGEGRYLIATGAKVIDADRETCRKGAAPRVLIEDTEGQRFLVGTDGGTHRTYYMRVGSEVATCRNAHESLCGFDETLIVNKS